MHEKTNYKFILIILFIILLIFISRKKETFYSNNSKSNIKSRLISEIKRNNSIMALRDINKSFSKLFHEHTYVLYDLRTLLGEKTINYLEIGSYIGSSAALLLNHTFRSNIYCIDPLNLDKKHFNGTLSQGKTLKKNLNRHNKNNYNIKIIKGFSNEKNTINKVKNIQFDLFFIDGDHSYKVVKQDFYNYHNLVKKGGYIVFDDYLDYQYSPDVKLAVDDIVKEIKQNKLPYLVIGSLPNYLKAITQFNKIPTKFSNEFILYKYN